MFEQIFTDDDVKEFKKTFLNKIQTQNIYFDRYSLLSCLYLFNCKKILLKYERVLLRNYNAPIVDKGYNATIDRQFCKIAKLNTQFYLSDTPTPIVILLLMGNYKKALKLQKLLSTNEDETLKLNKILDYNQIDEVVISNGKIKKKPLTPKQIFVRVLLAIFCLIVFVVPTTLIINYIKIESNLIYTYSKEYNGYVVRCGKFYNPQILYIPNDYNGKDVVGIQSRAFTNKNNLKKVNLGVNLKFIENDCFFNCENLSEINILSNPNIPYEDLEKSTNKDVDIIIKFLISVFDGESLFKEFQVQFGSLFTFEKIEIPGYTFTGLFDDNDNCIVDENGNSLDIYNVYDNMSLYLKSIANTNNIVFNGNGETSGSMSCQQIKTAQTMALQANKFEKLGYTFIGWSTTANGDVEYQNQAEYLMGTNAVYNLYAVWAIGDVYLITNELSFKILTTLTYNNFDEIRLTRDLDFNNMEIPNFSYFTTIFNGNGYTISNIKLTNKCGLFESASNAIIKNLKLKNIQLTNSLKITQSIGGLVGTIYNTTITQCCTTGQIRVDKLTVDNQDVRLEIGGLVGNLASTTNNVIENCYSTCDIDAKANYYIHAGGLIGRFTAGANVTVTISNCYATGNIKSYANPNKSGSRAYSGGFISHTNKYKGDFSATLNISNCFATGNVDAYANEYNYLGGFTASIVNVKYDNLNNFAVNSQKFYINGIQQNYGNWMYCTCTKLLDILNFVYENWDSNVWELSSDILPILK